MSITNKSLINNINTNTENREKGGVKRPQFLSDVSMRKEILTKDIKELLAYLRKEFTEILKAHKHYIEKEKSIPQEFKTRKNKFLTDMNQLYFLHPLAIKNERRKKINANGRVGKGFLTPKCFNKDLTSFIQEAKNEFGRSFYLDEKGNLVEEKTFIIDKFPYLRIGITATSLLTILFHIYIKRNYTTMFIPENPSCIKFTPLMKKYFEKYKEPMEKLIKEKNRQKGKEENEGLPINFDNFPLIRLQNLFSLLIDRNPEEDKRKGLEDPQTKEMILEEQLRLSKINEILKKNHSNTKKNENSKQKSKKLENNEKSNEISEGNVEDKKKERILESSFEKAPERENHNEDMSFQEKTMTKRKKERTEKKHKDFSEEDLSLEESLESKGESRKQEAGVSEKKNMQKKRKLINAPK
jgi:hypothetical protein